MNMIDDQNITNNQNIINNQNILEISLIIIKKLFDEVNLGI